MKEEKNKKRMRVYAFTEAVFNCDWERFQSLLDQGLWDDSLLKGMAREETGELPFQRTECLCQLIFRAKKEK